MKGPFIHVRWMKGPFIVENYGVGVQATEPMVMLPV